MLQVVASPLRRLRAVGTQARRLGNTDTALFVGWGMAAVGFGLIEIYIGLIAGGVSLAIGSLYTARGGQ